ncbi:hypothetical protein BGX27_004084 [Mortierella sp. AM989]|nr:hypothetical protein BGX27_004084 [Mortierella sp. AM989]
MTERHTYNAAAASTSTAASTEAKQRSALLDENDYDELVDEEWLDLNSSSYPVRRSSLNKSLSASDDQQVPTFASPIQNTAENSVAYSASTFPLHSDFEDTASSARKDVVPPANLAAVAVIDPSTLLKVLTEESPKQAGQIHIPGSPSPTSTSDSEYSLLNPSAEQSRKNSLSGSAGFHPFTSNEPTAGAQLTEDSEQDQGQDSLEQEHYDQQTVAFTSPSFSDFVQVASDLGEDFSGVESISARSSNNETSSSTSSDGKGRLDEDDEVASNPRPSGAYSIGSTKAQGQTLARVDRDVVAEAVTQAGTEATAISSVVAPSISAGRRAMYRTTVEDAENSEDEQNFRNRTAGMRYRGPSPQQNDHEDFRRSFFSNATATSTMPGAFNPGLDTETPVFKAPAAATATTLNAPPVDERQCRICLGGADEEDTLGRLISPCLCKGSMKYVHVECLNAWRSRSPKPESHYKCDTCKYSFSFRRTSFARYLAHPLTVFVLTIIVFVAAVFAAGFAMKLLLYLLMDEPQEFIYPVDIDDYDDDELVQLKESVVIFKTPDSLKAVFRIDKTHMVFGSFFVSIIGFLQLLLSAVWMGGGGGVFRIGGFGLGGGRRGARGERQQEAGIGGLLMVMILVFGLFKSVYMTYQFVHRMSRRVLAKAELMTPAAGSSGSEHDATIRRMINDGHSCADIEEAAGEGAFDRYYDILNPDLVSLWTTDEILRLNKIVQDFMAQTKSATCTVKEAPCNSLCYEEDLPWDKIAEKLGFSSAGSCNYVWKTFGDGRPLPKKDDDSQGHEEGMTANSKSGQSPSSEELLCNSLQGSSSQQCSWTTLSRTTTLANPSLSDLVPAIQPSNICISPESRIIDGKNGTAYGQEYDSTYQTSTRSQVHLQKLITTRRILQELALAKLQEQERRQCELGKFLEGVTLCNRQRSTIRNSIAERHIGTEIREDLLSTTSEPSPRPQKRRRQVLTQSPTIIDLTEDTRTTIGPDTLETSSDKYNSPANDEAGQSVFAAQLMSLDSQHSLKANTSSLATAPTVIDLTSDTDRMPASLSSEPRPKLQLSQQPGLHMKSPQNPASGCENQTWTAEDAIKIWRTRQQVGDNWEYISRQALAGKHSPNSCRAFVLGNESD